MIERESVSNGSSAHDPAADSGRVFTFRKLRRARDADPRSIKLTLFRVPSGRVCGWFIGPLAFAEGVISMPHLAPATETLAPVAVIRAIAAAEAIGSHVCLVDPDDLWTPVWRP